MEEYLQILARRMKDFENFFIAHQCHKRRQIEAFGQGVDGLRFVLAAQLHDAELRPKRVFTHKLCVDGDVAVVGYATAKIGERLTIIYYGHGRVCSAFLWVVKDMCFGAGA
jgi:hypothetical protein